MILTGKAKRRFLKWLKTRVNSILHEIDKIDFWFSLQDESFKLSLIVEWLESVGIFIDSLHSYSFDDTLEYCVKVNNIYITHGIKNKPINRFKSRQEATKQAIFKANEIYNERHK